MKERLLISFSGGRTSAYMTWWLFKNLSYKYEMLVVFANTGKEREETLKFIKKCDEHFGWNVRWVECITNKQSGKGVKAKVVNFETANRDGKVFEDMIAKHGIPNQQFGHCSRELKAYTIRAYVKKLGWKRKDYKTAIGIRFDEISRVNWKTAKKERLIYPLASMHRCTTSDINRFWSTMPFDLELKSYEGNCDLCWKKSKRKLMTLVLENPESVKWWMEMEKKYDNYIPESRSHNEKISLPIRFYRENKSIEDIIQEAQQPFKLATDTSKEFDFYKQMEVWSVELDTNDGCVESCEAF